MDLVRLLPNPLPKYQVPDPARKEDLVRSLFPCGVFCCENSHAHPS